MRYSLVLFLLSSGFVVDAANTYYVRTDGNNANTGTTDSAGGAWRNIWYATTQVSAGDTVNVKAGTYNEFVTNTVNGSAGSPITFNGERSGSDWATIIEPSTDLSTGWVAASEIGSYVWKQTNSFTVRYMTIDGRRAAWFTSLGDMTSQINSCYVSSGMTSGSNLLAAASDKTVTLQFGGGTITFWDGIKAAFCSDGIICYLRFADNSEPNGKNIRVAPNSPAAVGLSGRSYITWRNFKVIGAYEGFSLSSAANNNIIESNYVSGTTTRVMITGGAWGNIISNNTLMIDYYGWTNIGGWDGGSDYTSLVRKHTYVISKYLQDTSGSTTDNGVYFASTGGRSNVVTGNVISGSIGNGVGFLNVSGTPWTNSIISSNTIEKCSSIGFMPAEGHYGTRFFGNLVSDNNLNVRLHHIDAEDNPRLTYIFRNRMWLPANISHHFYIYHASENGQTYHPEFWIYHNSLSGGQGGIYFSGREEENGGLLGCRWLNNLTSGTAWADTENTVLAWWQLDGGIAEYDYNLSTPPAVTYPSSSNPDWWGAHNIKATTNQWTSAEGMSFALPLGSQAIDAAVDIPTSYPTLPLDGTAKTGAQWDIGALEYSEATTRTGQSTTMNIGTIQFQ